MSAEILMMLLVAEPGSFETLLENVGTRTHEQSIADTERWVDSHADDAEAPRALLWMAQLELMDLQWSSARQHFDRLEAQHPGSSFHTEALMGLGDVANFEHRFDDALVKYREVSTDSRAQWKFLGEQRIKQTREEQTRWRVLEGAILFLASVMLVRTIRARHVLRPMPEVVWWLLPVFAVLIVSASGQEGRGAVFSFCLVALVWAWLDGAYARLDAVNSIPHRVLRAFLGALQASALLFVVIVSNGLWDTFVITVTGGGE